MRRRSLLPLFALVGGLLIGCSTSRTASPTPSAEPPAPTLTASAVSATAPGTASFVSPTPSATPASPVATPAPPAPAWTTYDRDIARTGLDPSAPPLGTPHRIWASVSLDGDVYGQPLVLGDRVYAATENDTVYALDLKTGRVLWQTHVGDPVPGSALPCGNIDPSGITGTPVVDTTSNTLYAVAFVRPGYHDLVAFDATNGAIRFRRQIDPPGANPLVQQQRGALVLSRGMVYVVYGGLFGDCGAYHGWVVGLRADGSGNLLSYQVPTAREGGIWAPPGPAVDASGDLYVSTGNGSSDTTFDYGNSVIRLSPDLRPLDWFAPPNWAELNRGDVDLGSVTPALLEDGLVFQIGKAGVGYLLRGDRLGQIGGQVFSAPLCAGAFGGTAYAPPYLYVSCRDGIVALKIGPGERFTVAWRGSSSATGAPIVAGGAVWVIDTSAGVLDVLDAATGTVRFTEAIGPVMHFASPSAAGGDIFVPASRQIIAYAVR